MVTIAGTQNASFVVGGDYGSADPQAPKKGPTAITNKTCWVQRPPATSTAAATALFADVENLPAVGPEYFEGVDQEGGGEGDDSSRYALLVTTVGAAPGSGHDMLTLRYLENSAGGTIKQAVPGSGSKQADTMVMQVSVRGGTHVARRIFRRA
jgi:hypothetical protein